MIDRRSFEADWIASIKDIGGLANRLVAERTIHAFYLLQKIEKSKLSGSYVFKGGTACMLLFQRTHRFSVDIDLLVDPKCQIRIGDIALSLRDEIFYRVEEDVRKAGPIRKRHFKFYYRSAIDNTYVEHYVLLDAVFESNPYTQIEDRPIEFPWLVTKEPLKEVPMPSPSDLLGDKLCALAPHTVGVLFSDGKDVETIKQLFDVARLAERTDIQTKVAFQTYERLVGEQAEARNLSLTPNDAMDDALEMCRLLISKGKRKNGDADYRHLMRGFEAFGAFVPGRYGEIELLRDAARVYMFLAARRFPQKKGTPASNNGTFVGRRYRLLRMVLKERMTPFMITVANDPFAGQDN